MKNKYLNFILFFSAFVFLTSCEEESFVEYGNGDNQVITDAYLQINSPVVSFQAGTPSYEIDFNVLNGSHAVSSVKVYSTFTDAKTQGVSEPVLLKSIDVGSGKTAVIENLTYENLKDGVTVGGNALPSDDLELAIGSGWVLKFEGEASDGSKIPLGGSINIAVLSRFAGLYKIIETDYYRINAQSSAADWSGGNRFIGSVDETTFSYNDFWGPFGWTGSSFNFTIDPNDNTIIAPIVNSSGLFSGNRPLGCDTEPEMFVDVPCDGSDILEINDETGKHIIKLTYGYFTDGSGSRQFYEVLEKIVD